MAPTIPVGVGPQRLVGVCVSAWRAAISPPASGVDGPRTFLDHLLHHLEA